MSDTSSEASGYRYRDFTVGQSSFLFNSISRPTTASSIRAKLWSRERQAYEEECCRNMLEFKRRPYMRYEYPEIPKHYPGTWRTADTAEIDAIVERLTKKTFASVERERDIKNHHKRVLKLRCKSTKVEKQSLKMK